GLAQRWGTSDSGVGGVIGSVPLQVTGVLGFYSEAHTLRLLAGDSQAALRHLETGIMAGSPSKDYWREACPLSEWTWPVIFVRPNLVGRIYACIIGFSWDIYLGRTGQAMDRLAATNIVFAARQFKQKQGRWPTQESDLVPAYLKAWPTSALGGQPLRWLDDKSGILILGDDGKKLCEPSQWCRLPFDPPAPVAQASKRVR
ncbi:MAG: hypothetical protein HW398_707, partial [Acidobacteria bacterium]|nr:hypothetical protein [Acidobacteriota bacterium]